MSKKPSILIFTAFHNRPEISQIYWQGIERLRESFNIKTLSIISDESNKKIAEKNSDYVVLSENIPLGKKLNTGMKEAITKDFDFLMQLGSDNIITNTGMEINEFYYNSGVQLFGLGNTVMIDFETKKTKCFDFGAVWSCVSKELLEKTIKNKKIIMQTSLAGSNFSYAKGSSPTLPESIVKNWVDKGLAKYVESSLKLWDDDKMQGLDRNAEVVFESLGYTTFEVNTKTPNIYCIKSNENIWSFDFYEGEEYDLKKIKENISVSEFNSIFVTN